MVKIATWNVERLKHRKEIDEIVSCCNGSNADILVLTETDKRIQPNYKYCFHSSAVTNEFPVKYGDTENRVSIFTNFPCVRHHKTYDSHTAICVELQTDIGNLLVYGTIIGIYGNRHPTFMLDLANQMRDIDRLSKLGLALCICGDFNCSFSDNYYFTHDARNKILKHLKNNSLILLTENEAECIDHIAITKSMVNLTNLRIEEWNIDKRLSDHKGVAVEI